MRHAVWLGLTLVMWACSSPQKYASLTINWPMCASGTIWFHDTIHVLSKEGYSFRVVYDPEQYPIYSDSLGNHRIQIDRIPVGLYSFSHKNVYNETQQFDLELNHARHTISLDCLHSQDSIGYPSMLDALTENDSLLFTSTEYSCHAVLHFQPVKISKQGNTFFWEQQGIRKPLNEQQVSHFKKFERELIKLHSLAFDCSLSQEYVFVHQSDTVVYTDYSCCWKGYSRLYREIMQ